MPEDRVFFILHLDSLKGAKEKSKNSFSEGLKQLESAGKTFGFVQFILPRSLVEKLPALITPKTKSEEALVKVARDYMAVRFKIEKARRNKPF